MQLMLAGVKHVARHESSNAPSFQSIVVFNTEKYLRSESLETTYPRLPCPLCYPRLFIASYSLSKCSFDFFTSRVVVSTGGQHLPLGPQRSFRRSYTARNWSPSYLGVQSIGHKRAYQSLQLPPPSQASTPGHVDASRLRFGPALHLVRKFHAVRVLP